MQKRTAPDTCWWRCELGCHSRDVHVRLTSLSAAWPSDMAIEGLEVASLKEGLGVRLTPTQIRAHLDRFKTLDKRGKGMCFAFRISHLFSSHS